MRVQWSGAGVTGAGLTTWYFDEAVNGHTAAAVAFFTAVANRFPTGIAWAVPNSGDLIDVASGELSGSWTNGTAATVNSSGGNGYVRGAGCSVEWSTSGIRNGRRVLGRTFLCPLDNGAWSTTGTMNGTAQGALQTAVNNFLTAAPHLRIYSRPTPASPTGASSAVTAGTVPSDVSWLRSRRT